ncbi:glycosyltransferase family A protein [Winogradskyella tangerina]|uniref:glycosyltransferase family A protein n=1 Tax=Winogradskyella tangerina TaxID=2023240 RepID=UPI000DBE5CF5|nr:glycosyltransferase family A protein [Winogradskyella tangerina]
MLTFIIPVKSKSVASNWTNFCQLFERTLKSICNQTVSDFKVVVVCHEIPDIEFTHESLHFIHPEFDPPSLENDDRQDLLINQRIDKGDKIKLGVDYAIKEFNTDYVMMVDSDDLISNKIAAYVNKNGNGLSGWYVRRGYLNFNWNNILVVTKKFSYLCGSSLIVKPELVKYFFDQGEIKLYFNHQLTTLNSDIELKPFPFSGGIYNIGNGENIWMSFRKVKKLNNHGNWVSSQSLKRLYTKFKNYRFRLITPGLREEFNFYN